MTRKILLIIITATSILMYGCVAPTTQRVKTDDAAVAIEAQKQREIALQETLENHYRLNRVGWPILKAGLPLCKDRNSKSNIGITYANKFDFDGEYKDVAISRFKLGEPLEILDVISNTPADISGLKSGDVLISVNNKEIPIGKNASKEFTKLLKKESDENTNTTLSFRINRDGINETVTVETVETCDYPLSVIGDDSVNAFADGNQIVFHQGMMDFTKDDDELALVVGHELSHNAMRHIDAKTVNMLGGLLVDIFFAALGADTQGAFSKMAAQAYSQDFEAEADYVGLYVTELAGYDISNAAYFWRKMGVKHPASINKNHAASHPSTPERFVAIEESIKEINQKKESGQELMPNMEKDILDDREPPPAPAFSL
jgi:hypothetical protein